VSYDVINVLLKNSNELVPDEHPNVYWLYAWQQGIAGLDCWIAQSGLQSNLVDWIVIDNPKAKLDFGFGLSIQFCHFNPNPIH